MRRRRYCQARISACNQTSIEMPGLSLLMTCATIVDFF